MSAPRRSLPFAAEPPAAPARSDSPPQNREPATGRGTFPVRPAGNTASMQPETPTQPLPIARVNVGMTVVDADGEEVGTVTAVQMPGTDVRPDLAAGIAERLMGAGYLRIDGTGLLSNDVYAAGDEIAESVEGEPATVTLTVARGDLARA